MCVKSLGSFPWEMTMMNCYIKHHIEKIPGWIILHVCDVRKQNDCTGWVTGHHSTWCHPGQGWLIWQGCFVKMKISEYHWSLFCKISKCHNSLFWKKWKYQKCLFCKISKYHNSLFCKIEIYQSITASCPEKINKSQLTVLQIIKTSEYTVHCFAKYQTSKLPNFKI